MKRTVIRATGRHVPPRIVTNAEMTRWMDTSDEWIRQRTGIEQRHWVPEEGGVGSSDLALEAARVALDRCQWQPRSTRTPNTLPIDRVGEALACPDPIRNLKAAFPMHCHSRRTIDDLVSRALANPGVG